MSSLRFSNPTALGVGTEGTLFGRHATVIGRSVLSTSDGYRWDEYHVKLDGTAETTLVYESGIWKRYDLFDPESPVSARDASGYRVGDQVTLRGKSAHVTYVGQSTVSYIQGKAPEGYRVGSQACYFNAEADGQLFVVSWTGDEVEFYEGKNLYRGEVERGFRLPNPSLLARIFSGGSGSLDDWFEGDHRLGGLILLVAGCMAFLLFEGAGSSGGSANPPSPTPAPALHLPVRAQGELAGHQYVITGRQVTEVAEMRGRFGRHEYHLTDEEGRPAVLIRGLSWSARQWYLFRPSSDPATVWPTMAATYRIGSIFRAEGRQAIVRSQFLCRTIAAEGEVPLGAGPGLVRYGFTAQDNDTWVLARWTENDIEILVGSMLSEREVDRAFGLGVPN